MKMPFYFKIATTNELTKHRINTELDKESNFVVTSLLDNLVGMVMKGRCGMDWTL
jgi:hypothetical protein